MLSKTRCPIGSKNAVFNLLIKGGPAPEKCYARVWPGHRVASDNMMMQVYKKGGTNQNKNMEMTYEQIQKELGLGVQIE